MKYLLLSLIVMSSQIASASFFERCGLRGEVTAVGQIQLPGVSHKHYQRPVKLKVLSVKTGPRSQSSCDNYVGKEMKLMLESVALQDLVSVKKKAPLSVRYTYANNLTADGVREFKQALLESLSLKIYNKVFNHPAVSEAMTLLIGQLNGELQVGQVQSLLSSCGFAGCDSDALVMLTMGNKQSNAQAATIVVKVHMDAFGEMTALKIISNPSKLFL